MHEPTEAHSDTPADPTGIGSEASFIKRLFGLLLFRLLRLETDRGRLQGHFVESLLKQLLTVDTPRGPLSYVAMGKDPAQRVASVLTKQPETIAWIETFGPDSVFWDIGANVGVFTLYAALRRDVKVVAIEPAAVNYYALAANCEANHFEHRVECLLLALGRRRGLGHVEMTQFVPGKSFSLLGKRDRPYESRQAALVLSIDELVDDFGLPCPHHLKIDVPGVTEDIVHGAERTLARPEVRSIHMEVQSTSTGGRRIIPYLEQLGFVAAGPTGKGSGTNLTFVRR